MEGWIIVGVVAVSMASLMIYVMLMFFFPEWVGITGTVAKKAIESHVEVSGSEAQGQEEVVRTS